MNTVTVDITLSINGQKTGHVFPNLSAQDARHVGDHLIGHALQKINAMMPDDPAVIAGSNSFEFDYVTTRDSDGAVIGSQVNVWPILDDAALGSIQGAYDGALAKMDKRLSAKGHVK